ncbi:hypothetical protein [Gallaecimonas sp. GXIMD4217]|uniref:hypothetical protein n=1 Tax=Gallaecimonas sp. GXIMD4217 TaxID=3131927 RepID=UPI00311B1852
MTYQSRQVDFLGIWAKGAWQLKAYGIHLPHQPLDNQLKLQARRLLDATLAGVAATELPAGFVGIHQGEGRNVIFIDWWRGNELHHRLFLSALDNPLQFLPAGPDDFIACVWDLGLMAYEREAWIEKVLQGGDLAAYLHQRLDNNL